jgi:HD-GYP domain-containing protein (c-di-GMP phosphodiesterase class II)
MKPSFLNKLETISLQSKVARRIFFLFIMCALLPLLALAFFSFNQVSDQLRSQAEEHLHQTCKTTGLTIFERLSFLEADLETIVVYLRANAPRGIAKLPHDSVRRLANRFEFISRLTEDNHLINYHGSGDYLPELDEDDAEHLKLGKTTIKSVRKDGGQPNIYMIKAIDPHSMKSGLLFGKIDRDYLWGGKGSLTLITNTFVIDESKNILFSALPDNNIPLTEFKRALMSHPSMGTFEWSFDGSSYLASYWTLFVKHQFNIRWMLVHSQDRSEILQPLDYFKKIFILVIILTFLIVLALSISQIRRSLVPIELLQQATHRVAEKDFGSHVRIDSHDEFEELGNSFNDMIDSIANQIKVMKTINKIGLKLSAEKDTYRLLQSILNGARIVTNADCYALFSVEDKKLKLSIMVIDSLDKVRGSSSQELIPLYDMDNNPNINNVAAYTVLEDKTVNIQDIYSEKEFDFSYNYELDRETGYESRSFLSVPLKDHENEIVGVLQLINARDKKSGEIIQFSDDDRRLTETLASQAGVALSKNRLVKDLKDLFDDLVELIATAIDEKSPYTGGHSRRVSDLTMLLAEAVSSKTDGAFKDVSFSEQNLYELKISSLLHDCGKITTPVHVMDKSSKLETIFDRIHLINTRFEILKRDKQIALVRKELSAVKAPDNPEPEEIEKELQKSIDQLERDREFIQHWNTGRDFMSEDDKRELKEIAGKYRWRDKDGKEKYILSDEELHNLTVTQGTITPEEREILNNHINLTIKMLESLSYPKSLRNVPQIVATHHERTDGSGYPKGLTGDQIPLQGKILAIADVFEALIAGDRPYKKAKTIAEALHILGELKEEGKIDADIFNVLISEEVYLKYAEKHLRPEQLGEIVLSRIPGYDASVVSDA